MDLKEARDYSSSQGQVLYVPDQGEMGIDRVTVLEWSNNTYTESPQPPWWGGFRPEPHSKDWASAVDGPLGSPIYCARGMGPWSNCGLLLFSNGWITTAGTCTAKGGNPVFRFPPTKIPTSISVTPKNEFALVTICDTEQKKGQVAVLALESWGRGHFLHEWKEPHYGLASVALFTGIKLLGYIDLPDIEFPTSVCGVGDSLGNRLSGKSPHNAMLSEFDLADPADRASFFSGNNASYISRSGFAVVGAKYENKAVFIDLQPLFTRLREMYFTTEENYQQTRKAGADPKQWPYGFDVDPSWKPVIVKVVEQASPTAVLASMVGGAKARAFIASVDGTISVYSVGGLATQATPSPEDIRKVGDVRVGRNPVCLNYQKGSHDTLIAASRGDREIAWVRYDDNGARVFKILRDQRMVDPVHLEQADTHGTEAQLITVTDFKGRKLINYRYSEAVFATNGGARFGMGPDGKSEFECGGVLELPGEPFCISATNVN